MTLHASEQWFPVVTCLCRSCGHVFSNPRLTPAELSSFYAGEFRQSFDVPRGEKIGLFHADSDFLLDVLGHGCGRRVIEVGSYTGYMLNRLLNNGWVPEGLEPNRESALESMKKFDIPVHVCMLEDFLVDRENLYDLVFMGSVLEHVNSPTKTLGLANDLIKEDGYLYIRVPSAENLNLDTVADVFPLEHPHMFSSPALEILLKKCGFLPICNRNIPEHRRHIFCIAKKVSKPGEAREVQVQDTARYSIMRQIISEYNVYNRRQRQEIAARVSHLISPVRKSVVIYGAGNHTEFLLRYTDLSRANILRIIDSDRRKWGSRCFGYLVLGPESLLDGDFDAIVISSRAFQEEIFKDVVSVVPSSVEVLGLYDSAASEYPAG